VAAAAGGARAELALLLLALGSAADFGRELHLRHTPLAPLAQAQLAAALLQHNRTLLLLDLSNTRLTCDAVTGEPLPTGPGPGGKGGLRGLAGWVARHPILQTLVLNDNPLLGDAAAAALAAALDPTPPAAARAAGNGAAGLAAPAPAQMATLGLARCGVKRRGVAALAAVLGRNACLAHLDLDGNVAGPHGGAALGAALRSNGSLLTLKLAGNGLVRFDAAQQRHAFEVTLNEQLWTRSRFGGWRQHVTALAFSFSLYLCWLKSLVFAHAP
jgi:hypothetical protein